MVFLHFCYFWGGVVFFNRHDFNIGKNSKCTRDSGAARKLEEVSISYLKQVDSRHNVRRLQVSLTARREERREDAAAVLSKPCINQLQDRIASLSVVNITSLKDPSLPTKGKKER